MELGVKLVFEIIPVGLDVAFDDQISEECIVDANDDRQVACTEETKYDGRQDQQQKASNDIWIIMNPL